MTHCAMGVTTTGNVYLQIIDESVMRAVNSHASILLEAGRRWLKA